MERGKKIRVLVVDDSPVFRELIIRGISVDPQVEIVAVAGDPFEARDKILEVRPDVLTCDVEMPKMNGIDFIRRLIPQYFVPVVMVSAVSAAVFEAMEVGAVDFVVKPEIHSPLSVEIFINDLITKIKIASGVKAGIKSQWPRPEKGAFKVAGNLGLRADTIIAIGASTGGTEAIFSILSSLPPAVPGIAIVQHIPPGFSRMFADRLNSQTSLQVKEAQDGDFMEQGKVLIAPGDRHMRLKKVGTRYKVECFYGEKVNGHCPSVDVLFESVAREAGNAAVGIILTGMGYDGAKGLLTMRRRGARTIGQDEKTSVVYGMPKVAFDLKAVDMQCALSSIPQTLFELLYQVLS